MTTTTPTTTPTPAPPVPEPPRPAPPVTQGRGATAADPAIAGAVVVGVDGSEDADRAVVWAAEQARREHRRLVLLRGSALVGHSIYPGAEYLMMDQASVDAEASTGRAVLAASREQALRAGGDLDVTTLDVRTDPRLALVEASDRAHLMVVGSRGRGHTSSILMGSVSASLAARAACPVVVVRPQAVDAEHKPGVVVGARLDPGSVAVVDYAFAQASLRGVPLRVVHFYFDTETTDIQLTAMAGSSSLRQELAEPMAETVAGLREKYPDVDVHLDLATGAFRALLAETAGHHDLVVVGRRTGGRLDRAIGTWSTLSIVENAHGTVVVVPETVG